MFTSGLFTEETGLIGAVPENIQPAVAASFRRSVIGLRQFRLFGKVVFDDFGESLSCGFNDSDVLRYYNDRTVLL